MLTDANPPAVKSVRLGNVNGVTLRTRRAARATPRRPRTATRYKITGTATGVDMANPMQPVNKPFEIDATCS